MGRGPGRTGSALALALAMLLGASLALVSDGCSAPAPRQSRRVTREEPRQPSEVAGEPSEESPVKPPDLEEKAEEGSGKALAAAPEENESAESEPAEPPAPEKKVTSKKAEPAEEAVSDEEPPAEPKKPAPKTAKAIAKSSDKKGAKMTPDELIRFMGLDRQSKVKEAEELVKQARADRSNLEVELAEEHLEQAIKLDPENDEAKALLGEVRTLLGDKRGQVPQVARDLVEQERVYKKQAQAEVRNAIHTGDRHFDIKEFDGAIREYEKAIEMIRNFPYNLQLDGEFAEAQKRLASAKEARRSQAEEERLDLERRIRETKETERKNDFKLSANRVKELRRKAAEAMEMKDFERVEEITGQILVDFPDDEEVKSLHAQAREERHAKNSSNIILAEMENHERALISLEESAISYQKIFRYPAGKEWQKLQPKIITLEEKVSSEESVVEKDIKRKLDEAQTIEFPAGTSFAEALKTLISISGINFILSKEAGEAVKSGDIKVDLPPMKNMPLKSILFHLLQAAGDKNFTYKIEKGAVNIGTKEAMKANLYVVFYDIKDVTQPHPDYPAPPLALEDLAGTNRQAGAGISVGDEAEETKATGTLEIQKLIDLIKKEQTDAGGEQVGPDPKVQSGKMMVKTSLENHQKVQRLLAQLRKATGIMVTVESRFLDIQDNFLEEIGVDMGNGNNTFLPNSIPDIDGSGTSIAPGYESTNSDGDFDFRSGTISQLSQPLGSKVNPFNLSAKGGGAYQLNIFDAEKFQLEAILTGVGKKQEIRRLSSPRVTAFNTQISHTLVINQAAYIQDLEVNQTGVIPVINPVIGVLNSGSILEVRPTVSYDRKYVVLEIQPTLAEKLQSERALLNLSGNFTVVPVELPVLSVTKIKTTVTIPDGGTVLVGGLRREIKSEESIGVPILKRIPILGILFGRRGESSLRSNLFVLINAKITIVQEEEERLFNT